MKNFFTKTAALMGLTVAFGLFLTPLAAFGQCAPNGTNSTSNYCLLVPIPGAANNGTTVDTSNFNSYLSPILTVLYSMAGVLAVYEIVYGGFIRATSDAVSGQEEGRDRIVRAFIGLIIIFTSYALLNTINPNLLKFSVVDVASLKTLINTNVTGGFQNGTNNSSSATQSSLPSSNSANGVPSNAPLPYSPSAD